ncbi:MAG TPA: hypothetical protein VKH35_17725 [Thermoanaerobaculia bacterium]|nr:hypothetical protein [Thermoanaerobaculia bacterium]
MKRFLFLSLAALLAFSCSTTDSDESSYGPARDETAAARPAAGGLELLPPAQWWHQPLLAEPLKLTAGQVQALDKADQSGEVQRIGNDTFVAARELRDLLDSSQPAPADIVAAGQRLRALRDSMFDRQVTMLAGERGIVTQEQWQTLQTELQQQRTRRNRNNDFPRRGGRGMGGGRGRWPGF